MRNSNILIWNFFLMIIFHNVNKTQIVVWQSISSCNQASYFMCLSEFNVINSPCCKLDSYCALAFQIELIACKPWQQVTLSNTRVTNEHNCNKKQESCTCLYQCVLYRGRHGTGQQNATVATLFSNSRNVREVAYGCRALTCPTASIINMIQPVLVANNKL